MRLLTFRVLALGILITLYLVHPLAGLTALAGGAAFGIWQKARRVAAYR